MQPFTLGSVCKETLWGGVRLREWDNRPESPKGSGRIAESWKLAAHPDGDCVALDGPCAGMRLSQIAKAHPEIVSLRCKPDDPFPLLVKLIDTQLPLSIQVHPDDAYAAKFEMDRGKSEMWYVLDCAPGAFVYLGFQGGVARKEVERALECGKFLQLLHQVKVHRGDSFFIPAGTVHSIGGGVLLAEVEQSSNLAYRLFDFNRVGSNGKLRALHVKKALDVARMGPAGLECFGAPRMIGEGGLELLVNCPEFQSGVLRLDGAFEGKAQSTFLSLLCLEGAATLHSQTLPEEGLRARKGTSFFVPADAGAFALKGRARFLMSCLPVGGPPRTDI